MATADGVTGRILVVEEDRAERSHLARSLREQGHVVAEAADATEALGWTASWPPDVVLLDRALPDGGLELLGRLKADAVTRDVPVVVVASPPAVGEVLRHGAHDFLSKPYQSEELLARTQAALRTKALADELRSAAVQDPVTGLRNRRGVLEQLSSWRAHCRRHATPLAVALVGIDRFPDVEQEHGETTGERVLRAVAEALQACVRREDVVGRWSGHEFVVVLPQADASAAVALVQRAGARLAGQRLLPGHTVALRAGVAVVAPDSPEEDEPLLARAAASLRQQRS